MGSEPLWQSRCCLTWPTDLCAEANVTSLTGLSPSRCVQSPTSGLADLSFQHDPVSQVNGLFKLNRISVNQRLCSLPHVVRVNVPHPPSVPDSTAATLIVSNCFSQHSLDLAQPVQICCHKNSLLGRVARIVGLLGRTSHQLDEAQPGSLEAGSDKAYRHERRVAPVAMLCFRQSLAAPDREAISDVPDSCWFQQAADAKSVRATASGEAPAKTSSFSLLRVLYVPQETVSRLAPDSGDCLIFQELCVSTSV